MISPTTTSVRFPSVVLRKIRLKALLRSSRDQVTLTLSPPKARSPSLTSWPPLILTHFTEFFFFFHWIPLDLSSSHYDVWCYPNQMSCVFSAAWERSSEKQPSILKNASFAPNQNPTTLLSPRVCFGQTNGFRQINSQRRVCPLQSPHLRSGWNVRAAHNLMHEHKFCNGGKTGSRLRKRECPNS